MLDPISTERPQTDNSPVPDAARTRHQEDPPKTHQVNTAPRASDLHHAKVASTAGARVTLSVDAQLRETIIKVVDPDTGKVLRQIPSEERVRMQRAYEDEQHRQGTGLGSAVKSDVA